VDELSEGRNHHARARTRDGWGTNSRARLIDVCQTCGGIWLDRGELEKLTEFERRYDGDTRRDRRDDRRNDDDDDDGGGGGQGLLGRIFGGLGNLGD
jgi:Transcription factor zinc-finger